MEKQLVATLFTRYHKPIRKWMSNRGVDHATAEELTQEVFVRLLRYEPKQEIDNVGGYIWTVGANVLHEWNERARQRKPHDAEWLDELIDEVQPDDSTESADYQEAITRCLEQLPPRYVQVITMHTHDGLTYKEIAAKLDITPRMVLRDLTRSYSHVRALLEGSGDAIPLAPGVKRERVLELLRKITKPAKPPINERRVKAALEAAGFIVSKAARILDITESTMHRRVREFIEDFELTRAEWIAKRDAEREAARLAKKRPDLDVNELLTVIRACSYNLRQVAKALNRSEGGIHATVRRLIPDFDQRRADFIKLRDEARRAAAEQAWQDECKRRSEFFRDFNLQRSANGREQRLAERMDRVRALEDRRQALIESHAKETGALLLEEETAIAALRAQFRPRFQQMRERHKAERKEMTVDIESCRRSLPNYVALLRKDRIERKAARNQKIIAALNATGGKVRTASRLFLGGMNLGVIKRVKCNQWRKRPAARPTQRTPRISDEHSFATE